MALDRLKRILTLMEDPSFILRPRQQVGDPLGQQEENTPEGNPSAFIPPDLKAPKKNTPINKAAMEGYSNRMLGSNPPVPTEGETPFNARKRYLNMSRASMDTNFPDISASKKGMLRGNY